VRAVHALQVFVSRLRKSLRTVCADAVILTQPPGYLVRLPPESLDAARFDALVSTARQQGSAGAPERASGTLRAALGLWRGPALIDVVDAPIARAQAARLEEARLVATEERLDADLACGRHAELTAELDALTQAHPVRERLWGQRMLALYRSGRQVEALRVYRDLRKLLADEVGLEPSPALAALETAILRQAPHLDWQPPTPVVAPPVAAASTATATETAIATFAARTPYVGRETERAELTLLLDRARVSQGAVALLAGEPGVGKTRLAEELGAHAAGMGFQVLVGRCYESEGVPPYMPFVEILEQALAAAPTPAAFRALLAEDAPEVAKLLPRLRRLFPDIPPPLELPFEQERHYLFNSLRDFVGRVASAAPLLLVVDDLHWADEATILLWHRLSVATLQEPLLLIASSRPPVGRKDVARLRMGIERRGGDIIDLTPMPEMGVTGAA
jgi:DNA-binding SARP family transcriptional activator